MRLAVLGAGGHSRALHGPALRQLARGGEVALEGICDLDPDRAEQYRSDFGFARAYHDADQMLDEIRPDGLLLITPIQLTGELACRFASKGIPLLIEKPPGKDETTAQQIVEESRRHGTPVMVSLNRRFSPALVTARNWFETRNIQPTLFDATMLRVKRGEPGFVSETGIHMVDAVLSLMGDPEDFQVESSVQTVGEGPVTVSLIKTDDGRMARFLFGPCSGCLEETYTLTGAGFQAQVDVMRHRAVGVETGGEPAGWSLDYETVAEAKLPDVVEETRAFLSALRRERPFAPTVQTALRSFRAARTMQAAASAG